MNVENFLQILKDSLFPVFCISCKKEGALMCPFCISEISVRGMFQCPVCQSEKNFGISCAECKKYTPLSSHIALAPYRETESIGKLLHEWKYNFVTDAFSILIPMIEDFIVNKKELFQNIDYIVPVPLHKKRLAWRGFNQAEEIAKVVAHVLHKDMKNILLRKISTEQQAKLNKEERQKNVKSAFIVNGDLSLQGKNILFVDDVFTTGATINECALILKKNGAGELRAFTLVRG